MDTKKFEQAKKYHHIINSLKKIICDIKDNDVIHIKTFGGSSFVPDQTEIPKEINKELICFFKTTLQHYEELFKSL